MLLETCSYGRQEGRLQEDMSRDIRHSCIGRTRGWDPEPLSEAGGSLSSVVEKPNHLLLTLG